MKEKKLENLFLGVGAMKAGTTWLYQQLSDHPQIYFTPEKEIHYFAYMDNLSTKLSKMERLKKLKQNVFKRYSNRKLDEINKHLNEIDWYLKYAKPKVLSDQWYINLFKYNRNCKYNADFSNLYCLMDDKGWDRVYNVGDNVKVIYTLRDPLSRLWSHYKFHMKWMKKEDEAIDAGFENFKNLLNGQWFWKNAEYAENYKRLKKHVDKNNLMLLYFEDFRENPIGMLKEIHRFLEIEVVEPKKEKLKKQVNKTKDFAMPGEWKAYAIEKLKPLVFEMKNEGIWHKSWNELY